MTRVAGWYSDPKYPAGLRWWDGLAWTNRVKRTPSVLPNPDTEPSVNLKQTNDNIAALRKEVQDLQTQIIETREIMLLQEVGLYEYAHPLDSSAAYKDALQTIEELMKLSIKSGNAVTGTKKWAINGSEKDGAKMVADFSKLMLRAYNTEADNIIHTLKPYSLDSAKERLEKMRQSIAKLVASMNIQITDEYHGYRIKELELTADFIAKLAEEKEREREERARLREEEIARREYEREQQKLEKEKTHYCTALAALQEKGDLKAIAETQAKLSDIEHAIEGVVQRAANAKAGYVYVISNIGSLGSAIVKIGMTRRLDPMDRVRELGDASVPFRFDVHAIIFSDDAVGLETALHRQFAAKRVNLVNLHREYFYASPLEVKTALTRLQGNLLTFNDTPEALEWHQSEGARRGLGGGDPTSG